jgi:hypothetical protein
MTKDELKTDESKTIIELVIKDKLKKEAEEYFKSICGDYNEEYERTGKRHYFVGFDIKNAYFAGAKPREKRIAELEEQIEKMKCPWTCKKFSNCKSSICPCDEWEIKEK